MFKATATKIAVFAFDTTTGAPKTGDAANITVYVSKDYGAVTALTDTSATEMDATNAKGWYLFDVTGTEATADALLFTGKSSTANISIVGQLIFTTPANFSTLSVDSNGRVDVIKVAGTTQTAGDIIADTNDIQTRLPAALVSGRMDSSVGAMAANTLTAAATAADFGAEMATAVWTDTTAGDFTVALSVGKSVMNGVSLGTGLTVAAVSGAVGSVTGAVGSVTGAVGSVTGNVGGNVVGSVASVTAGVTVTTNNDKTGYALTAAEEVAIADALLGRNVSGGSSAGRTVKQALHVLRNKTAIAGGTLTVYDTDDTTSSFTAAVTTTAGDPISAIDPA